MGGETTSILQSLLDQVSTVAVVDTSSQVRFETIHELASHKDLICQLAQDRVSSHLSQGVYDDYPPAQELFIRLICDLSSMHEHAGWAKPVLRALIMRVLVDLGDPKDTSLDEQVVAGVVGLQSVPRLHHACARCSLNLNFDQSCLLFSCRKCTHIGCAASRRTSRSRVQCAISCRDCCCTS